MWQKESYKPVSVAVRLRSTPYVVTCNIFVLCCSWQNQTRWGSLQRSPDPLAGFKGAYFSAINLFTVDSRRVVSAR